jgi:hypothetical protein
MQKVVISPQELNRREYVSPRPLILYLLAPWHILASSFTKVLFLVNHIIR